MLYNKLMFFGIVTVLALINFVPDVGAEADADNAAAYKTEIELATVCVEGLCGYVNNKGEWHIPPKFAAADPFSKDGLAWVITVDNWGKAYIEKGEGADDTSIYTGRTHKILYPIFRDIDTEALTLYGGKIGLINIQGEGKYFGRRCLRCDLGF